jgi:hypothetical protein
MMQSKLMNAAAFTSSLEDEYRKRWTKWCDKARTDIPGDIPDIVRDL